MSRRPFHLVIALTFPALSIAQHDALLMDSITHAIDEQVWRPFVRAFNAQDADAFLAVHAKNVVRWPLGWGAPQMGDSVEVQTRRQWGNPKRQVEERSIELWFTHRSHTNDFAYDIGYYQVTVVPNEGMVKKPMGHFTTIIGREDGRWKIFLDADNGAGVTSEDLKKGVLLLTP